MSLDPYAACPCGSGKKAKWCCLPIWGGIEKAFHQHEQGQHEAALRTMDEVIAAHPDKPEAYGRKAILLFDIGQVAEAEQMLDKAFSIDPNYAAGHHLRGQFRMAERDPVKALSHFRKAVEAYDPEAREQISAMYALIADIEMRLNHPVAARAALQIAARIDPASPEFRQGLEEAFGDKAFLPASAKKEYVYKSLPADAPEEKKNAWNKALAQQSTGRLGDALKAFEELTTSDPDNAAAWYNLGLTRAWLGENAAAVEALNEYVEREPNEEEVSSAWALAEVLRCGDGVPPTETDYATYSRTYQIVDPQGFSRAFGQFEQEKRLRNAQLLEEDRIFTAIVVEAPTVLIAGAAPSEAPRYAAQMMILANIFRLWSINESSLAKIAQELEQRLGQALSPPAEDSGPCLFMDVLAEAMVFPLIDSEDQIEEARNTVRKGAEEFFEETWIHRPLRSLSGVPPIDATGHATLKKKLRGVVQFLEECARMQAFPYEFDRLRRKLDLGGVGAAQPLASAEPGKQDISAMSAAELASLDSESLSDQELEQAYHSAQRLDARELSTNFLKKLVARPPSAEKTDRFPWYGQLIQQALSESKLDEALDHVNEGEKVDCEHNEGRRRNDYELWRGRIHARRGEIDAAQDVFDRLIARAPDELRYRGTAAEAMLSAKDKERALRFAQEGLAQARKQQDRDSEQYFMELSEAAQRK